MIRALILRAARAITAWFTRRDLTCDHGSGWRPDIHPCDLTGRDPIEGRHDD